MKIADTIGGRVEQAFTVAHEKPMQFIFIPVAVMAVAALLRLLFATFLEDNTPLLASTILEFCGLGLQFLSSAFVISIMVPTLQKMIEKQQVTVYESFVEALKKTAKLFRLYLGVFCYMVYIPMIVSAVAYLGSWISVYYFNAAIDPMHIATVTVWPINVCLAIKAAVQAVYAQYIAVTTDVGVWKSIRKSAKQVKGKWWLTLGRIMAPIPMVIMLVVIASMAMVSSGLWLYDEQLARIPVVLFGCYLVVMLYNYMYMTYRKTGGEK